MSAWNANPVVLTVAVTGADVFRENNPNIPYTTAGDRRVERRGGAGGRDRRAPARARGRRHAQRSAGAVQGRDRAHPRRQRPADDGLDRRQQRDDDRGAHHRPGGEARHLRRRVRLDELRRRHVHHPAAAARGIIERAPGAGIALEVEAFDVGHVVSAVRWLRAGHPAAAAAHQPGLRRARRHRRLARGAGGDDAAAAARRLLDRHLHRPPPPAHARRWRCCTARPASAPGWRTSPTCAGACWLPRTPRWPRRRST